MTVIAVRVHLTEVDIAVDSQTSYGEFTVQRRTSLADSKMWEVGGLVIAFCGTSALGSILRRWTRQHTPDDADEAAITGYVDRFYRWRRDQFPDSGDIDDMSFVLVFKGAAWVIDGYSVSGVPVGGYFAHGSGLPVALGALYAGSDAMTAVAAACRHGPGCDLPVVVAKITPKLIVGNVERVSKIVSACAEIEEAA